MYLCYLQTCDKIIKIYNSKGYDMRALDSYSLILFPVYKYATIPCNGEYYNDFFDDLLKEIGKHCFGRPNASVNEICRLIRDRINCEWHLNRIRKRTKGKSVSATQIKTIRRSFKKISNHEKYIIRIPFDVVSILVYILSLAKSIDTENSIIYTYIRKMNEDTIGNVIYALCHPNKNGHRKASKNGMNRILSFVFERRPHLFHGSLDNEPLPT